MTCLSLDVVIANLREDFVDQLYMDLSFKTIASAKEFMVIINRKKFLKA